MRHAIYEPIYSMNIFIKTLFWAKNYLFPGACVLCGRSFISVNEIRTSLCDDCRPSIIVIDGEKCGFCGKPLISEEGICVPCRNLSPTDEKINEGAAEKTSEFKRQSYDRLWTLFPYTGRYRKILTSYKFKKVLPITRLFIEKIIDCVSDNPVLQNAVIVPVPPRKGKIKHSGWDQVDYLVKRLKRHTGKIKINKCLKRKKSKIQKHLNRKERIENLKDRIYIQGGAPETALIIDDVITTGSTMEVCAKALKDAGAKTVYGLCLFYD